MELQEAKRREWWEEQKKDSFDKYYDCSSFVQVAHPLEFLLRQYKNACENT